MVSSSGSCSSRRKIDPKDENVLCSFRTSVPSHLTIQHLIPEDLNLHQHYDENMEFCGGRGFLISGLIKIFKISCFTFVVKALGSYDFHCGMWPIHFLLSAVLTYMHAYIYRVSQEECARLREGVPYVKVYRYNPKHLCPKLNGYGDNGQRNLKL